MGSVGTLYLVFGIQGGGKTTWVNSNAPLRGPDAIFFSGPLPSRKHRARALALARKCQCRTVAVWIKVPFEVAVAHNTQRSGLARIREETIQHVYESLEPPTIEEGFDEVVEVTAWDAEA